MLNLKLYTILLLIVNINLFADSPISENPWNGKKAAIVLTYDDALDDHLDKVIPDLTKYGLKATFYTTGESQSLNKRKDEWSKITKLGYELGNHTIYHPCVGKSMGRDWVTPEKDLDNYTIKKYLNEIDSASKLLKSIDGLDKRTFAYTCGDQAINDTSFISLIKDKFVAMRGVNPGIKTIDQVNILDINSYMIEEKMSTQDLIDLVDQAIAKKGLLVFLFHGVGGNYALDYQRNKHQMLLKYLNSKNNDIWVATMLEVGDFINREMP